MAIGAIFISLFILGFLLLNFSNDFNIILDVIILIFICLIGLVGAWAYNPKTWNWLNIIYENGISDLGSPFVSFSDIEKIGYGKKDNGSKFIKIFSHNKSWKLSPTIIEEEYINNYYNQAVKILNEKCPNVPWVEMKWLEWKK